MTESKEFQNMITTITRVVAVKNHSCTLEQILREYRQWKHKKFSYEQYGYKSELDLLKNTNLFKFKTRDNKIFIELKNIKSKPKSVKIMKTKKPNKNLKLQASEKYDPKIIYNDIHMIDLFKKFDDKNVNITTIESKLKTKLLNVTSENEKIEEKQQKQEQEEKEQKEQQFNKTIDNSKTIRSSSYHENIKTEMNKYFEQNKIKNIEMKKLRSNNVEFPSIKSFGNKYLSLDENYSNRLLIYILHYKVSYHKNGFFAESLPKWYERTFGKYLPNNWFDLIRRSKMFFEESINHKTLLYAIKNEQIDDE